MFRQSVAICFTLLVAQSVPGSDARTGSLTIVKPWARATPPGATVGAVYLEIVNSGAVSDTLQSVETTVARRAELHSMSTEGGVMRMRQLPAVTIPAHGQVRFNPEGKHVMLIDLLKPLQQGGRVVLTLVFARAGRLSVEAPIRGLGAMSDSDGGITDAHPN